MTPVPVGLADIHIGDQLRFERDGYRIEGVVRDVSDEQGLFFGIAWVDVTGATLTLLSRAVPPIPTDDGTVIQSVDDVTRVYVHTRGAWIGVRSGDPDLSDPTRWRVLGTVTP